MSGPKTCRAPFFCEHIRRREVYVHSPQNNSLQLLTLLVYRNVLLVFSNFASSPSPSSLAANAIITIDSQFVTLHLHPRSQTLFVMGRLNLPSNGGHTSRSSRNVSCYPSEHPSSKSLFQHYKDDDPSESEICTTTYRPSRNSGITDSRIKRERQHEVNVFELEQLLKSKIHRNYSHYSSPDDMFPHLKLANRQESDEASSFTDTVSTKISSNSHTQDQSSLVQTNISTGDAQASYTTEDTMSDISELTNVESIQRGESLVEINQVVLGSSSQHTGSSASTLFTEEESQAYEYNRRVRFAEGTVYVVSFLPSTYESNHNNLTSSCPLDRQNNWKAPRNSSLERAS